MIHENISYAIKGAIFFTQAQAQQNWAKLSLSIVLAVPKRSA
jgi:hypothetical protein|tara:strand:+ start:597 stop:722 length:126 start_codon:yes stop_codon:yes gene_type:complete